MRRQIESALEPLIGLPLWGGGRTSILHWFHFGERRELRRPDGSATEAGDFDLHVQCAWRLGDRSSIIVASADRYLAAGPDPFLESALARWDEPGANRCDERLAAFFAGGAPSVVEGVRADNVGGIQLRLSAMLTLELFPDHSLEGEYWRLFRPGAESEHFVVAGTVVGT